MAPPPRFQGNWIGWRKNAPDNKKIRGQGMKSLAGGSGGRSPLASLPPRSFISLFPEPAARPASARAGGCPLGPAGPSRPPSPRAGCPTSPTCAPSKRKRLKTRNSTINCTWQKTTSRSKTCPERKFLTLNTKKPPVGGHCTSDRTCFQLQSLV